MSLARITKVARFARYFPRAPIHIMTVNTVNSDPRLHAQQPGEQRNFTSTAPELRSNSHHRPRTGHSSEEPNVYVLTLLTDEAHHRGMTALRRAYFPRKLNKLESHITLFHALPEEKLEGEIVPGIEAIVAQTRPYRLEASEPFRLSKGVAIEVADDIDNAKKGREGRGRNMTRIIHAELRKKWSEWLSEQDSKPPRIHYTIMNKVSDDTVVDKCLTEVGEYLKHGKMPSRIMQGNEEQSSKSSKADQDDGKQESLKLIGEVEGLTLWKYEKSGHWVDPRHFKF